MFESSIKQCLAFFNFLHRFLLLRSFCNNALCSCLRAFLFWASRSLCIGSIISSPVVPSSAVQIRPNLEQIPFFCVVSFTGIKQLSGSKGAATSPGRATRNFCVNLKFEW